MGVFQNNLMGAAAAAAAGGGGTTIYDYQIANSVRLNGSNQYFNRTASSGSTNSDKKAISVWYKRAGTTGNTGATYIMSCQQDRLAALFVNDGDTADNFGYFTDNGGQNGKGKFLQRDFSAWYHLVFLYDATLSTGVDRVKVYINGVHYTTADTTFWNIDNNGYPGSGTQIGFGMQNNENNIGRYQYNGSGYFNGYLADFIMIDGGTVPSISDFGETVNGVWVPKDPSGLTFGTNGFWLKFESGSDLGNDSSGNNNDWTANNFSAHDQMLDTPTFNSSANGGNFCTLSGIAKQSTVTVTEGNLRCDSSNASIVANVESSYGFTSGKIYFEMTNHTGSNGSYPVMTVTDAGAYNFDDTAYYGYGVNRGGDYIINASNTANVGSLNCSSTSDIRMFAIDFDNSKLWAGKNGTWYNTSGTSYTNSTGPESGNNYIVNGWNYDVAKLFTGHNDSSCGVNFNFGQDGTFAGNKTAQGNSDATGYGNFYYTVPDGFLAVCSGNQPVADAVDPAQTDDDYPQKVVTALAYTGDGNTTRSFDIGFKPNLSWVKQRSHTYQHILYDTNRTYATLKALSPDGNWAEGGGGDNSGNGYLSSSDSSGFSVNRGTNTSAGTSLTNTSSTTYASWHWKEGADYGLDIVTYTGSLTSSGVANISHSLGAIPECIWHMSRGQTGGGAIRHQNLTSANYIMSNNSTMSGSSGDGWGTSAQGDKSGNGNMTALGTSTTFTTNYTGVLNVNGDTYVAYVWRGIEGLSKFGSYEGNGNADGPFVYTGFRPAIVINKRIDGNGSYLIHDNSRNTFNVTDKIIAANDGGAEFSGSNDKIDMLSNGFKMRSSNAGINGNGNDYIYMAWAHNPFKYATAR